MEKKSIFNKWCWHNWISTCRRMKIDPYLSPCTKLKSKWIKDLNIKPATPNLIKEKHSKEDSANKRENQVQMDQRYQHKASHTEPYRRVSGKYT